MPRLILIRHAKSAWDDPALDDHERPLNRRGRRAAALVAHWLAGQGARPDTALVSSAARTRETWALMAPVLGGTPRVEIVPALYHARPDTMLAVLRGARGACVAMLGHNPGIAGFAALLADAPPDDPEFTRYPTCAATLFDFGERGWADIGPGTGRVAAFAVPRRLEG